MYTTFTYNKYQYNNLIYSQCNPTSISRHRLSLVLGGPLTGTKPTEPYYLTLSISPKTGTKKPPRITRVAVF